MSCKQNSNTLFIRHLCPELKLSEKEDFLKHFGAQKVWFANAKTTAFASFESHYAASTAMFRLHQLEIFGKRLTVEFSNGPTDSQTCNANLSPKNESEPIKKFMESLNSLNYSLNVKQPPPPNIYYKYPEVSAQIIFNIAYALSKNVQLYVQTLHLMNKIGLDPPFTEINPKVKDFILDCLEKVQIEIKLNPTITSFKPPVTNQAQLSSEESEISSEENEMLPEIITALPLKRKSMLKRINKKPKLINEPSFLNTKKSAIYNPQEIFEDNKICETRKIEVKVNKNVLEEIQKQDDKAHIVGVIGKMLPIEAKDNHSEETEIESGKKYKVNMITSRELAENKISKNDLKSLPIFKNYHPGTPSMRLYIKNLSKDVTVEDIEHIYRRYIINCDFKEAEMFDIRLMQEGRMKGQAFVTLPSVPLSEQALSETNGFILKNKPMVVQFARTAKINNT